MTTADLLVYRRFSLRNTISISPRSSHPAKYNVPPYLSNHSRQSAGLFGFRVFLQESRPFQGDARVRERREGG